MLQAFLVPITNDAAQVFVPGVRQPFQSAIQGLHAVSAQAIRGDARSSKESLRMPEHVLA
jgi:hypothetical protein